MDMANTVSIDIYRIKAWAPSVDVKFVYTIDIDRIETWVKNGAKMCMGFSTVHRLPLN